MKAMTGQVEERGRFNGRTKLACITQKHDPAIHTTYIYIHVHVYINLFIYLYRKLGNFHRKNFGDHNQRQKLNKCNVLFNE